LDGTPASKYLTWLENGTLVGVSLETAFKLLQKEFFDEEEEALIACEKWRNRKQKLDETLDEYHAVFMSNADRADITLDKELLQQWARSVLPPLRAAVQTARCSNPTLTFQSGVKVARDVHAALYEDEPATAYKKRTREDMDEDLADTRRVRAVASNASEDVIRSMAAEMAHIRGELMKAQCQIAAVETNERSGFIPPEPRDGSNPQRTKSSLRNLRCPKCSSVYHDKEHCRFVSECFICGEKGHKANLCAKRKRYQE